MYIVKVKAGIKVQILINRVGLRNSFVFNEFLSDSNHTHIQSIPDLVGDLARQWDPFRDNGSWSTICGVATMGMELSSSKFVSAINIYKWPAGCV